MILKNIIKLCRFSKDSVDDGDLPIQQIEYQGKTGDSLRILPYGMDANIPEDALGILLNLMSQEQNRVVLPISPKERPKNLEVGDVVFYSPITGEKILFKAAGGIVISGDVTYENDVTYNGNVGIDGDLTVIGDTILGANVTSNGKNISDTHTHNGSPTAPTGAVSPTGVPV